MFNPSELEGEVDHAFFDSDCDDSSTNKDGGEKVATVLKTIEESPPANKRHHDKLPDKTNAVSPRTDETTKHAQQVVQVHKNVYTKSPEETEEEEFPFNAKLSDIKSRNKHSPKKQKKNWRTRSPSPTSTEASVDADSESSSSSSNGRSSLGSPTFPTSNKFLVSRVRKTRVGSAGSQDIPSSHTVESDDTVTDVSPISSPDISHVQSLDMNQEDAAEGSQKMEQQEEIVPSSGLSSSYQDEDSDHNVDECSLHSESHLGSKQVFRYLEGRNRKNYSFSNDDVQRIDRENQRLLQELSRLSPGSRPGSVARKKTSTASHLPLIRLSHSALNRQREQQRIERENLAFLKRLESVKATPGLKRSEQLADYQRQVGYLGASSYSICRFSSNKERSTTRTNSGARPTRSALLSSSSISVTSDSSRTPGPTSKKLSAARPAWS